MRSSRWKEIRESELEVGAREKNSLAVARVSIERFLGLWSDRVISWARFQGIVSENFGFEAPRGGLQLKRGELS
jgi:hypothetical protein